MKTRNTNATSNTVNTVREATARLLATENISVIQDPKTSTAYFDLKSRTLALPVWRDMTNEMYDMLVGHEVGHALFTPNGNGGWRDSAKRIAAEAGFAGDAQAERVAQGYLNVVEDARIERLIKERYPGLRRDFFTAYTEFAKRDIFSLKGRPVSGLSLADRLNLHFKIGFTTPIPFSQAERVFIDRMERAVTWEDVVGIAQDLFDYKPQGGESGRGGKGDGKTVSSDADADGEGESVTLDGDDGEGNGDGSDGQGDKGDAPKGKSGSGDSQSDADADGDSGESEGTDGTSDGQGDAQESGSAARSNGQGVNTDPVVPSEAKTAGSLDDAMRQMRDSSARSREYVYIPKEIDTEKFVVQFPEFISVCRNWEQHGTKGGDANCRLQSFKDIDKRIADMVEDTRGTISAFVREFEMLKTADEHRRTVESKSGRLDMDQAWKFRISDNLFKVATTMRDGKSHGFVLFIDWSGSMQPQMEQTMRQLYILFQFCRKVGIPFDVYAFGVGIHDWKAVPSLAVRLPARERGEDTGRVSLTEGRNECNPNVELLHILSSRGTARDIQDGFRYCLACALNLSYYDYPPFTLGGSTPLDSTIVVARGIVNDFRKTTKVQIVNTVFLTDGEATDRLLAYGTGTRRSWNGVTVLRDGTREWVNPEGVYNDTGLLIRWFREQTGANTLGIFVASRFGYASGYIDPSFSEEKRREAERGFKSDGWCSVPALGFDNYFVLRGTVKDTEEAMDEFEKRDATGMTPTQIKNAYIKAVETRNSARGMIRTLVKIVA